MKRITMENCEQLENRKFKYVFSDGTVESVQVGIIDKNIGMTCVICDNPDSAGREVMCFDFRKSDKLNTRASFLVVANDIERGVFKADKWLSVFVPEYYSFGGSLSDCAFN